MKSPFFKGKMAGIELLVAVALAFLCKRFVVAIKCVKKAQSQAIFKAILAGFLYSLFAYFKSQSDVILGASRHKSVGGL